MPKVEERLSAVAKRRRLNDSLSSTTEPRSRIQPKRTPIKIAHQQQNFELEKPPHVEITDVKNAENSFSALVEQDVVYFSNSREIEQLDHQSIRIRLSKGQKCLIVGRYSLWVKDGVIDCYGAKLDPSTRLHHVFTIKGFDVPAVVALTDSVEFEVLSQSEAIPDCLGTAYFNWSIPGSDDILKTSFRVHTYTSTSDDRVVSSIKTFDASSLKEVIQRAHSCTAASAKLPPATILICGKQFVGTNTTMIHIINNILTAKKSNRPKTDYQDLLLLDLEPETPILTPPGTISLVHIRTPILGTAYASPGCFESCASTGPCTILEMRHLSPEDQTSPSAIFDALFAYVKRLRQKDYQRCPLIIKARSWLEQSDLAQGETMSKLVDASLVVCIGSESGSNSGQMGTLIATRRDTLPVMSLPLTNSKDPPLIVQHRLHLASYFHFNEYKSRRPEWLSLPLELNRNQQMWLSYGTETDLISSISISETHLPPLELSDMIRGCIVAIVLKGHMDREELQTPNREGSWTSTRQENSETRVSSGPHHRCVGLGVIVRLSSDCREICLLTPVSKVTLKSHRQEGAKLELIVQEAEPDGRFDTSWMQVQLETAAVSEKTRRVVYNRVFDIAQRDVGHSQF